MQLRSTAEQEEVNGVHSEGVYEIVPSVPCIDESASLTQSTCTDVFYRRVFGFNKPGTCVSHDVGKFVVCSERLRYQSSILPRNNGETHLHLTRARVEHNAELRKTNAALCRGKYNAALFYNPNQDVRKAMPGDFVCLLDDDGFKHTDIQIQRRSWTRRENTWSQRFKLEQSCDV